MTIGDDLNRELRDTAQKHYLNQLLKQVKKKLGTDAGGPDADVAMFNARLEKLKPSPEVILLIWLMTIRSASWYRRRSRGMQAWMVMVWKCLWPGRMWTG